MQPELTTTDVASYVERHYGRTGRAQALTGERDANFHFIANDGAEFVFKAACASAEEPDIDLPDGILLHLEGTDPGIPVPRVCRTPAGAYRIALVDAGGRRTEAMLCTFIPGVPLMSVQRCQAHRKKCGQWLARLGRALRSYEHPSCHRHLIWDLRRFSEVQGLLAQLPEALHRPALEEFVQAFGSRVAPTLEGLRRQVVHNDLNARNVIVDSADTTQVAGIIDFGDAVHTALVADVAVGVIGQLASPDVASEAIVEFVGAYHAVEPLSVEELGILNWLVAARLVTNYVVVSWSRAQRPHDGHFAAFGPEFFQWRLDLALQLAADPRSVLRRL